MENTITDTQVHERSLVRKYTPYILLLSCIFLYSLSWGEPGPSKKAQKYFDNGSYVLGLNQWQQAIIDFNKALDIDPEFDRARTKLADTYYRTRQFAEAIPHYKYLIEQTENFPLRHLLLLGESYFNTSNYDESIELTERYLATGYPGKLLKIKAEKIIRDAQFAKEAIAQPVPFKPENLGGSINSNFSEYLPAMTADKKFMVFTRRDDFQEDLYVADATNTELNWSEARSIGNNINTGHNEGAHCVSIDGNIVIYTACNVSGGYGSCDIYYTYKSKTGWSLPENFGPPINSPNWDSQPSISSDGKALYFVSNRAGGYGGKDIWVSFLKDDGNWNTPINLGPNVNTPYNEQAPFIHHDNETLYFTSDGHPGMGGEDVFVSRLKERKWGSAVNLGYPINTYTNESGITVSLEGKQAFFASDVKGGFGKLDIYEFELPEFARPHRVTYVKARVVDNENKALIKATYTFKNVETGETIVQNVTNLDGEFMVCLPVGKSYSLQVEKENYLFNTEHFSLKDEVSIKPYEIKINLFPIKKGEEVVLNNVFFDHNRSVIKVESYSELDKLVEFLNIESQLRIEISGHTDNTGNKEYNLSLSKNRAKSVIDYLGSKGIDKRRLIAKGYGDSEPIAKNDTEEGRAKNRRTTFKIIE